MRDVISKVIIARASRSLSKVSLIFTNLFVYFVGVNAWWTNFKAYMSEEKNVSDWRTTLVEGDSFDELRNNTTYLKPGMEFQNLLSQFLFSRQGSKFKPNFRFEGNLTCNAPAPPIKVNN